jgi:hypothetical protein
VIMRVNLFGTCRGRAHPLLTGTKKSPITYLTVNTALVCLMLETNINGETTIVTEVIITFAR